jgi:hypothetical protein
MGSGLLNGFSFVVGGPEGCRISPTSSSERLSRSTRRMTSLLTSVPGSARAEISVPGLREGAAVVGGRPLGEHQGGVVGVRPVMVGGHRVREPA